MSPQAIRYGLNGGLATAVHFWILTLNREWLHFSSAAWANLVAAVFGITCSFLGSRYFVFSAYHEKWLNQFIRFGMLYGIIALLHGLVLLIWTDWMSWDYRLGFLLATGLQMVLSYFGNKLIVFKVV